MFVLVLVRRAVWREGPFRISVIFPNHHSCVRTLIDLTDQEKKEAVKSRHTVPAAHRFSTSLLLLSRRTFSAKTPVAKITAPLAPANSEEGMEGQSGESNISCSTVSHMVGAMKGNLFFHWNSSELGQTPNPDGWLTPAARKLGLVSGFLFLDDWLITTQVNHMAVERMVGKAISGGLFPLCPYFLFLFSLIFLFFW
ncbi:hypothetical protein HOY82DRAFT_139569 [Tuber indicum]|nr:hypothetical protein HOY82DRAFT_139569 [Tuber indicum]